MMLCLIVNWNDCSTLITAISSISFLIVGFNIYIYISYVKSHVKKQTEALKNEFDSSIINSTYHFSAQINFSQYQTHFTQKKFALAFDSIMHAISYAIRLNTNGFAQSLVNILIEFIENYDFEFEEIVPEVIAFYINTTSLINDLPKEEIIRTFILKKVKNSK